MSHRPTESSECALSPGDRLRQAREAKKWSIEELAREINLSTYIVRALEADDYSKIEGSLFIRGYLRLYANVVEVSEHDIISRFNKLAASLPQKSNVPLTPTNNKFFSIGNRRKAVWRGCAVLLIGVLLTVGIHYRRHLAFPSIKMAFVHVPDTVQSVDNIKVSNQFVQDEADGKLTQLTLEQQA